MHLGFSARRVGRPDPPQHRSRPPPGGFRESILRRYPHLLIFGKSLLFNTITPCPRVNTRQTLPRQPRRPDLAQRCPRRQGLRVDHQFDHPAARRAHPFEGGGELAGLADPLGVEAVSLFEGDIVRVLDCRTDVDRAPAAVGCWPHQRGRRA